MDKTELRKKCLETRRGLGAADAAKLSAAIVARLRRLRVFRAADTLLVYVASKDNEVDTRPLIRRLLKGERPVLVPIAQPGGLLVWSRLMDMAELERRRFGIWEPRPEYRRVTSPPADALVIVPGIAFTTDGWRIGYGGGYFDRFLEGHGGARCALAYEMQIVSHIERAAHDMPMDYVVTESRTYVCHRRPPLT